MTVGMHAARGITYTGTPSYGAICNPRRRLNRRQLAVLYGSLDFMVAVERGRRTGD